MLIPSALSNHRRLNTLLLSAATLGLAAIGLVEFDQFFRLVAFNFHIGIMSDAAQYFGMGRGLLNGLHMYSDLFESKPPMIFWLSELSLRLTNSDVLYRVIQAVGLALVPISLALATCHLSQSRARTVRWLLTSLAFLFGSALATFIVSRSLAFQTEGFGVVPAILAILVFAARRPGQRLRAWAILAMALCITTAILLKEPFALSIVAGLLLLLRSRNDAIDALWAIGLAVLLWFAVLLLTGTFQGYVSLYLPEMLFGRVTENANYHDYITNTIFAVRAPLWLRGLNILRLFLDIASPEYRSFPAFPALALALSGVALAHRASTPDGPGRWQPFLWGCLAVLFFLLFTNLAFTFEQMVSYFAFRFPINDRFFQLLSLLLAFSFVACLVAFARIARSSPATAYRVAIMCIALYVASIAVATGGDFAPHHFLFAVPLYAAAFVALIRSADAPRVQPWITAVLAGMAFLLSLNVLAVPVAALSSPARQPTAPPATSAAHISDARASSHTFSEPLRIAIAIELELARIATRQRFSPLAFAAAKQTAQSQVAADTDQARQLDALLAACNIPRYFATPDTGLLVGLTVHSPYQLTYGLQRADAQRTLYFDNGSANPFFHAKLVSDFNATPIIVTGSTNDFPFADLAGRFTTEFSASPPPCARLHLPITGLHIFFKR